MFCDKCGNKNEESANFCRHCGAEFQKEKLITISDTSISEENLKRTGINKKQIGIVAAIIVVIISAVLINSFGLSKDEKMVLAACEDLQSSLDDSSSFIVSDTITLLKFPDNRNYIYFKYGADNNMGLTVKDYVLYVDGQYEMSGSEYNDPANDKTMEGINKKLNFAYIQLEVYKLNDVDVKIVRVNPEKIMKEMNIKK